MDRDNKLIFEAFDNSRQNAQLEKQIKMLVNNALKATFAAIETLEGIDSLPYSGEIDALTVNLDEEVGRLMDVLEEKMSKQHSTESNEVSASNLENAESASKNNIVQSNITNSSELFK